MTAHSDWQKQNTVMVSIRLQRGTDADLIAYLETCESKQATIKEALRLLIASKSK